MGVGKTDWTTGLQGVSNLLVRPTERIDHETICARLSEELAAPQALVVSYEQSIEDWLANHQQHPLDSVAFVRVGEPVRSAAAATPTTPPTAPDGDPIIEGVADPTDLTTLGLTIQSQLQTFDTAGRGDIVVCVDSLPALLAPVSLPRAFRFLHLLTTLIKTHNATAHYHTTPELTSEALETLRPLFDAELDTHDSPDPSTWTLHPRRATPTTP